MKICFMISELNIRCGGQRILSLVSNAVDNDENFEVSLLGVEKKYGAFPYHVNDNIIINSLDISFGDNIFRKITSKFMSFYRLRKYLKDYQGELQLAIGTEVIRQFDQSSEAVLILYFGKHWELA